MKYPKRCPSCAKTRSTGNVTSEQLTQRGRWGRRQPLSRATLWTGHLHGDDPPAQDDCKAYGSWPGRKHRRLLDQKCAGARSAGNPHAACDAAGAGNGDMVRTEAPALGESRRQQLLPLSLSTVPAPDPTGVRAGGTPGSRTPGSQASDQRRPQGADESAGEVAGVPVAAMYRAQARQLAPTLPGARTPLSTPTTGSMLAKPMTSSSPSGRLSRRPSSEA